MKLSMRTHNEFAPRPQLDCTAMLWEDYIFVSYKIFLTKLDIL